LIPRRPTQPRSLYPPNEDNLFVIAAHRVRLGGVSFLNDVASDMLTPLLPLFLTATLGAGQVVVGLIEGVAEGHRRILKLVAGRHGPSNAARP
jgi:hypothetical protein